MLRRYGESSTGESITRDILIPSDMPLHNLHYGVQKLFGWQNSHLRSFYLPEEVYQKLTGGTVKGWSDLVGIIYEGEDKEERANACAWAQSLGWSTKKTSNKTML